jgi:hypothetical protein
MIRGQTNVSAMVAVCVQTEQEIVWQHSVASSSAKQVNSPQTAAIINSTIMELKTRCTEPL